MDISSGSIYPLPTIANIMGARTALNPGPLNRNPLVSLGIDNSEGNQLVLFEDGTMGISRQEEQFDGSEYTMLYNSAEQLMKIEHDKGVNRFEQTYSTFAITLCLIYALVYIYVRTYQQYPLSLSKWEHFEAAWFLIPLVVAFINNRFRKGDSLIKIYPSNSDPHVFPILSKSSENADNFIVLSLGFSIIAIISVDGPELMCDLALLIIGLCLGAINMWPEINRPLFIPKGKELVELVDAEIFHQKSTNVVKQLLQKERVENPDLIELLRGNESQHLEFKASLWTTYKGTTDELANPNQAKKDLRLQDSVVKTVAAFLNSDGGNLLIGVLDKPRASEQLADVVGIEYDYKWCPKNRQDSEGFSHSVLQLLTDAIGSQSVVNLHVTITVEEFDEIPLCRVDVLPRKRERNNEIWVKTKTIGDEEFFFRALDTTVHASAKSAHDYIRHHFEGSAVDSNG